jgi:hypothetical protein
MSYAQTNYSKKMGTGPYSIAEIGCFLTSFCNLLTERFGQDVDPPSLDQWFIDNNKFIFDRDDRAYEDLGWGSVSQFNPRVHVTGTGGPGFPPSNNAIVKFLYTSHRTGALTTHFCLVADAAAGTIIDSWDGQVKHVSSTWYGNPVGWATYAIDEPPVIAPVQPEAPQPAAQVAEAPAFTVENIPAKEIQLKTDTSKWNLNDTTWGSFKSNPVSNDTAGSHFTVSAIAHHKLGGSYYMPDPSQAAGYNVVDCEDYVAPVAVEASAPAITVVPAPTPPAEAPPIVAAPAVALPEDHIAVTVLPKDPEAWKKSFVPGLGVVDYKAQINVIVTDVEGLRPNQELIAGMTVKIAGTFEKDGVRYWRTVKSVENNVWYGIPVVINNVPTLEKLSESLIDEALDVLYAHAPEIRRDLGIFTKHEKNINAGAKLAGSIDGFLHRKK